MRQKSAQSAHKKENPMKYKTIPILFLIAMTHLPAQELPPDLKAGADIAENGPDNRHLALMKDYISVMEAELAGLIEERDQLQNKLDTIDKRIKAHKTWAWITIPLGIAAMGAGVYSFISAETAYQNYNVADTSRNIDSYRDEIALYGPLAYSLGGGGLALSGAGTISAITTPSCQKLETRYQGLAEKITQLEEHLQ